MSVWVEIAVSQFCDDMVCGSRSTWACELKLTLEKSLTFTKSHAPRERVSWNAVILRKFEIDLNVTLHVSVWVEIYVQFCENIDYLSRSTWACELKLSTGAIFLIFSLSRSTWACELKLLPYHAQMFERWSRSTWACELKLPDTNKFTAKTSHAPRERVSWNCQVHHFLPLHTSRSTWACELKLRPCLKISAFNCHAPRERVSWN